MSSPNGDQTDNRRLEPQAEFMSVSLDDQIKCVRRELALMRHTYWHFVSRGVVRKSTATERLAAMEAALKTLKEIRDARVVNKWNFEVVGGWEPGTRPIDPTLEG